MSKDYGIHRLARKIPSMSDDEYRKLKDDIRKHGLVEPITLYEDKILDGTHRAKACKELGIEPETTVFDKGSPLAYVISKNVKRRHLSKSQKAMLALELLPEFEREAKQRQRQAGKLAGKGERKVTEKIQEPSREATADAARAADVNSRYISDAKHIQGHSSALADDVRSGKRTISQAKKIVKQQERQRQREAAVVTTPTGEGIVAGDFREAGKSIQDGSVDLIFTDPPYGNDTIGLYADLAKFAERVLRPGGWCLSYTGILFLPPVLTKMGEHLKYGWTFVCIHSGGEPRFRMLSIRNGWKPIVGFYRPPSNPWWDWFSDRVSGGKEKDHHEWQQAESEAAHFIKILCPKGGIVCDPFCGSGTTLAAAKRLGREGIGFEIDAGTAAVARQRLDDVTHNVAQPGSE